MPTFIQAKPDRSATLIVASLTILTWLAIGIQPLRAGTILVTDTTQGNPVVATFSPTDGVNSGHRCVSAVSDSCLTTFTVPPFLPIGSNAPTTVSFVQIIDEATNASVILPASDEGAFAEVHYADPNAAGEVGMNADVSWGGPSGAGGQLYEFDVFDFQGSSEEGFDPCGGQCEATITGGIQELWTLNYLDSGDNVLGGDVLEFEGQPVAAPEPGSQLLCICGLCVLAAGSALKTSAIQT